MTAGAPKKDPRFVKVPASFKLPRWLLSWLRQRSDKNKSMAVLIEEALIEKYDLKPPKIK